MPHVCPVKFSSLQRECSFVTSLMMERYLNSGVDMLLLRPLNLGLSSVWRFYAIMTRVFLITLYNLKQEVLLLAF